MSECWKTHFKKLSKIHQKSRHKTDRWDEKRHLISMPENIIIAQKYNSQSKYCYQNITIKNKKFKKYC